MGQNSSGTHFYLMYRFLSVKGLLIDAQENTHDVAFNIYIICKDLSVI